MYFHQASNFGWGRVEVIVFSFVVFVDNYLTFLHVVSKNFLEFLRKASYGSCEIVIGYEVHNFLAVFVLIDDCNRIAFISFRNRSTLIF